MLRQRRRDVPNTNQHVDRTVRGTQPNITKKHSHHWGKAPLGSPRYHPKNNKQTKATERKIPHAKVIKWSSGRTALLVFCSCRGCSGVPTYLRGPQSPSIAPSTGPPAHVLGAARGTAPPLTLLRLIHPQGRWAQVGVASRPQPSVGCCGRSGGSSRRQGAAASKPRGRSRQ